MPDMKRLRTLLSKYRQALTLLGLPLGMTVLVAALVYGPALFQKPQYDFIYSKCSSGSSGYCYGDSYYFDFRTQKISQYTMKSTYAEGENPGEFQLYYYSIANSKSQPITQNEANTFTLKDGTTAPDGYQLKQDADKSSLFGPYDQEYPYALYKGASKHHTDIKHAGYPEPTVIGWVMR